MHRGRVVRLEFAIRKASLFAFYSR